MTTKTFPLYSGEGWKRKLVGWLTSDGRLLTVGHLPSEATRVPKEWNPFIEVGKQMFPNKMHALRVEAMQQIADAHMAEFHGEEQSDTD